MVAVIDARDHRLPYQVLIHIRTHPVRVGERVVRAGRYEQALGVQPPSCKLFIRMMPIERETAFQPAFQFGVMCHPPAVRGQSIAIRQAIPDPDPFQRQVGQRSGRLPDGESWMCSAFQEHHIIAEYRKHAREDRRSESTADDRHFT